MTLEVCGAAAMARGLRAVASAVTERSGGLPLIANMTLFIIVFYCVKQRFSCFVQARPGHRLLIVPLSL